MIKVVDVTHHYGVRPVLRLVNLEVRQGEVLALMGPNGCGKSTLLGLMAGGLWPLNGYVQIDGKKRRESPQIELEIRKKVVYLTADPWLPYLRTGREWLLAVGRIWGVNTDHLLDHVERLLELFDLGDKADSPIQDYSTGQKKKIALAGALVTEAPIMLLDEPFSGGLDPSGILALKRVIQHRAASNHYTIVFATPVPELVEEMADRIAIMSAGRIAAIGTIEELRRHADAAGNLDDLYEKLVSPQTVRNIEHYIVGEKR